MLYIKIYFSGSLVGALKEIENFDHIVHKTLHLLFIKPSSFSSRIINWQRIREISFRL